MNVVPVVGIGASAGGLAAVSELLRALPSDTGLCYVLVQHLDPSHESALAEILSRVTRMPVHPASDGMRVTANCVYVIPPDTRIALTDGHLRVIPRAKARGAPTPINYFFQSLASACGGGAVAIVLSGTGADGAAGIQAIKAAGGITIAQEETSAQYANMPQNAMATGAVDLVLTPSEMAAELIRIGHHFALHPRSSELHEMDADLVAILALVWKKANVDFRQYKQSSIQRRVLRRMLLTKRDSFAAYLAFLEATPPEVDTLYHSLLIGVTSFFRDPEVFDALVRLGFPAMLAKRRREGAIRVWVPGCASGEEAYSIAMCLLEYQNDAVTDQPIQIFGTDLSEPAIAQARSGLYPTTIAAEVSPERLRRFFVLEAAGYRINKTVRDLCVFARQDLIRDPPFSQMDLISCRNLLIYLRSGLQKRVFELMHYALKPNGLLLLGTMESVGAGSQLFEPLDRKFALFRRLAGAAKRWPVPDAFPLDRLRRAAPIADATLARVEQHDDAVRREAERVLLTSYVPASVVVNDRLRIVQFHGRTADYLEHAPGTASLDLFRVVRTELISPLRTAVRRAAKAHETIRTESVPLTGVKGSGPPRHVDLEVIPFQSGTGNAAAFVILFSEAKSPGGAATRTTSRGSSRGRPRNEKKQIDALTEKLATVRRHLQEVIEEQKGVNEELRAANEEIQSSNEELQSTNEELETAKEELQSTNEELTTVNDEMQQRNLELRNTNADLSSVLANSQIPILIVGKDLRIRRFTPATVQVMKIAPSDVGRPLRDIKLNLQDADLEGLSERVMETFGTIEQKLTDSRGRWWMLTIRPFATPERQITGAVIAFHDTDAIEREAGRRLAASRAFGDAIMATVREPLLLLDENLRIQTASESYYATFRVSPGETINVPLPELGNGQWAVPELQSRLSEVLRANKPFDGFVVEHVFPAIGHRIMVLNARRLATVDQCPPLALLAIEDMTAQRRTEDRQNFLVRTSAQLASSLDEDRTLRFVGDALVPYLADWCAIHLHDSRGPDRLAVVRHGGTSESSEPGMSRNGPESETSWLARAVPDLESHVARVRQTGQGELITEPAGATGMRSPPDATPGDAGSPPNRALGEMPSGARMLIVPLITRDERLGTLSLGVVGPEREFDTDDLAFAEELGRRLAMALDNAHLFAKEQASRSAAEAANLAKADFLAAMSHELRTPLNAIQGYAQLLDMELRGPMNERQHEDIRRIERSQQHLTRLVSEVLDFAKLEAGHASIAISDILVGNIVAAIMEITEVQMRAKGLRFEYHSCREAVRVKADRERVQQILLNLLSNAIKFTPPGGQVVLSCDADERAVTLRVRDTGIGIAGDKLESIFVPFVQLDSGLTRRAEGTGLGLTISREFARGMGGDLTVESEFGVGSTFTLRLPRGSARRRLPGGREEKSDAVDDSSASPRTG